jgi:hypothetical protein
LLAGLPLHRHTPQVDYVALLGALNESCKEMGIQDVKPFVEKVRVDE